jgi:hypothetical protein
MQVSVGALCGFGWGSVKVSRRLHGDEGNVKVLVGVEGSISAEDITTRDTC